MHITFMTKSIPVAYAIEKAITKAIIEIIILVIFEIIDPPIHMFYFYFVHQAILLKVDNNS